MRNPYQQYSDDEISGIEIGAPVMPNFGAQRFAGPVAPGGFLPQGARMIAQGAAGTVAYQTAAGAIKRYLLPINSAPSAVAAGATANFSVNSQRAFRVERLILATDETGGAGTSLLLVATMDVGATPQFAATGVVPVTVFSNNAVFSAIRGDTATPGKVINLGIQNPTATSQKVWGAFMGESLDV